MASDFRHQVSLKSDQELMNIYLNSNEYQEAFIKATEEELERRNLDIGPIRRQKEEMANFNEELYKAGKPGNQTYIILSFISAFLGGFIGIVAGYVYNQSKHQDNAGRKYYVYDKKTRQLGGTIMIIGIFVFLVSLLVGFS